MRLLFVLTSISLPLYNVSQVNVFSPITTMRASSGISRYSIVEDPGKSFIFPYLAGKDRIQLCILSVFVYSLLIPCPRQY